MKKYLAELDYNEWCEVIKHNDALRRDLEERAEQDATFWVNEYLTGFPGNYCIDTCGYSYISIGEYPDFMKWYNEAEEAFELFYTYPEMQEIMEEAEKAYTDEAGADFDEHWDDLKERAEEIILRRLLEEYDGYDMCALVDFAENWIYESGEEGKEYFVAEDWKIYQHIPRQIIEAHDAQIM